MGVLDVEKVVFLEVVEKLNQLLGLLEVHLLIVNDLLDLFVLTTVHQLLKVPLEVTLSRHRRLPRQSARVHLPLRF